MASYMAVRCDLCVAARCVGCTHVRWRARSIMPGGGEGAAGSGEINYWPPHPFWECANCRLPSKAADVPLSTPCP